MNKYIVAALLTLTIATPALAGEKGHKSGENYTIRDRNYRVEGYVKDGRIYDRNYRIEGYIKDNKVYDRDYRIKGYLEPNDKQGDGHGR